MRQMPQLIPRFRGERAVVENIEQFLVLIGVERRAVCAEKFERVPFRAEIRAGDGDAAGRADLPDGVLQHRRRHDA